jgi:predicted alpha/beta-hydrolase family hydrolase
VSALLLTPGASATRDHGALVAIDAAAAPLGVIVSRIDLPRGKAERAVPVAEREAAALAERAGCAPGEVFLGGRSFGARVCSMAVAGGLPAAGLVLVSYPLHPPGKREQLRTEHFPQITVPCLFVSGDRDTFGTPEELAKAARKIAGEVTQVVVEGTDHGMRGKNDVVAGIVRDWLREQLGT